MPDIIRYILNKINYFDYLKEHYFKDHDARWANVGELISIAQKTPMPVDEDPADYSLNENESSVDSSTDHSSDEKDVDKLHQFIKIEFDSDSEEK